MNNKSYRSMESRFYVNRRDFLKTGSAAGVGLDGRQSIAG